jgi:copper homeostasis protein
MIPLEICVEINNEHQALNNALGSAAAQRIELCASMEYGGLSPDPNLVRIAVKEFRPGINLAMLRLRGDFLFQSGDLSSYQKILAQYAQAGVDGVVFGFEQDGRIDRSATESLMREVEKYSFSKTFHRAFDACKDRRESFRILMDLGFDRVLTCGALPGQEARVIANLDRLREEIAEFGDQIEFVLGGGVKISDLTSIRQKLSNATTFSLHAYSTFLRNEETQSHLVREAISILR